MAKLTKEANFIGRTIFTPAGEWWEVAAKLGRLERRGVELVGEICDYCCNYPIEADKDELPSLCEACPTTRLLALLE